MKRTIAAGALALALGAVLSACIVKEVRVGDDAECLNDVDCEQRGLRDHVCVDAQCEPPPSDPTWACLDQGPPQTSATEVVNVQLKMALNGDITKPSTNARVRACSRLDATCENPFGDSGGVPVDVAGVATLPVPANFDGYFEVFGPQGPAVFDPDFVRAMVFFPPREVLNGGKDRGVYVFSRSQMNLLAALGGGSFGGNDPSKPDEDIPTGIVLLTALTCEAQPADGVSFALLTEGAATDKTSQFYTFSNIPSPQPTQTDGSGTGGFTNLSPGLVAFSATLNDGQRLITESGGRGVYVRAGWYTQVYVAP